MDTLSAIVKRLALEMIAGAVRHPDPATRRLLAEHYFDLKYLYLYGLPTVPRPDLRVPWPPQPGPDPSPIDHLRRHDEILFDLLGAEDGDPEPEPNIRAILRDRGLRLAALKALSTRLKQALPRIDSAILNLERPG